MSLIDIYRDNIEKCLDLIRSTDLKDYDLSAKNGSGETILWKLIQMHKDEAMILLENHRDRLDLSEHTVDGYSRTIFEHTIYQSGRDIAMELLRFPDECELLHTDDNGVTALILACQADLKIALRIVERAPDKCGMEMESKSGETALMHACCGHHTGRDNTDRLDLVRLMLEHPDICNMGSQIPNDTEIHMSGCASGSTALIIACQTCQEDVALELLKYPDKCKIDAMDSDLCTALHYACAGEFNEVVKRLLEYPDSCGMNIQDDENRTPLLVSISEDNPDAALMLLKYPDRCGLELRDDEDNNVFSLIISRLNTMDDYSDDWEEEEIEERDKLMKIMDIIIDSGHFDLKIHVEEVMSPTEFALVDRYVNDQVVKKMKDILTPEQFEERMKNIEALKEKNRSISRERECIMCCEETHDNTVYISCKHVLSICDKCSEKTKNKCPICNTDTDVIKGVYIV